MPDEVPNHHEQPDPQDPFAYEVFVAYSAVDASWVQSTLVPQLHAAQVRIITSEVFELGAPKASEFERAVLSSGKTLLVLTPAALEDAWAEFAAILVHTLDPASRKRRFIPVIKEPCDLPLRFQGLVAFDATGTVDWERLISSLRVPLPESQSPAIPVLSVPNPAPLPPGSRMLLSHNPLFVGREEELRALAQVLKAGDTAAIGQIAAATGLGGIGKTQLAAEFVHRYGQFFGGGVFWLSFADPAAVPAEVAACGGDRGMRLRADFDQLPFDKQVQLVLAAWENPFPRLLVFDNCEDEALLDQWRPKYGGCRVLVTSRRADWDSALGVHTLPLGVLPRSQSIGLLRSFRPDLAENDADLDAIANEVGDLPLALHLAGSFLKQYRHDMTAAEYLDDLRAAMAIGHESLEGAGISPTQHDLSVARTFRLSYDRLDGNSLTDALALNILARAAYFAPGEPIPRDVLRATLALPANERQIPQGIRRLVDLGLLEEETTGTVRVHRLLTAFIQIVMADVEAQQAVEQAIADIAYRVNTHGNPGPLLVLQPHLRAVTNTAYLRGDDRGASLCNQLGVHLIAVGDYQAAQYYLEHALTIDERVLGPNHPDTASALSNLGSVFQAQGQLTKAQHYYEQALAIYEQVPGMSHPDTATAISNLGNILEAQGRYPEAQHYYDQALEIDQRVHGTEHRATAISFNNLGSVHRGQGHYPEAQHYYERALEIRERVLGTDHPDTGQSLNHLANIFRAQGQYPVAQRYYEQALAIVERLLGPDHPTTATTLGNLGGVLEEQAQYAQAQHYYERALEIDERVLGIDHPDTAQSLNNLANIFRAQGQYTEAQHYLEQALTITERVLGPDHPATATTLSNLGGMLKEQGQYAEAQHYYERVLEIRERVLGRDHPHTATILNNLGLILKLQGYYAEAQQYYEQSLTIRKQMLGMNHRDTAVSLVNLAGVFQAQGDDTNAKQYYEQALMILERVLGLDHPHTRSVHQALARLLDQRHEP